MPNSTPTCPKCRSAMEEGFIVDHQKKISEWVEGPPDQRWWGIKTDDKEKLKVITFRCTRCGYLESYTVSTDA